MTPNSASPILTSGFPPVPGQLDLRPANRAYAIQNGDWLSFPLNQKAEVTNFSKKIIQSLDLAVGFVKQRCSFCTLVGAPGPKHNCLMFSDVLPFWSARRAYCPFKIWQWMKPGNAWNVKSWTLCQIFAADLIRFFSGQKGSFLLGHSTSGSRSPDSGTHRQRRKGSVRLGLAGFCSKRALNGVYILTLSETDGFSELNIRGSGIPQKNTGTFAHLCCGLFGFVLSGHLVHWQRGAILGSICRGSQPRRWKTAWALFFLFRTPTMRKKLT